MLTRNDISTAVEIVVKEYPIKCVDLFGSYAEGRNNINSDVDLLVEFETEIVSLITISSLKNRLEEILCISDDVIHAPISKNSIIEIGKTIRLYPSMIKCI